MKYCILILMMTFSVSWTQGLAGMAAKAKEKMKQVENDVRATYALLELQTNPEFVDNSMKYDLKKGVLAYPDKQKVWDEKLGDRVKDVLKEGFKKAKENKNWAGERTYKNFGDIGTGITINNLFQGNFNPKIESKSTFFTRTVSRFYSFEVTEGSQNTVCECTAETSRRVIWPLIFKNRGMLFPFVRNLTQKVIETLNCTIYNDTEKYELEMVYDQYKVKSKHTIAQRIIKKIIPRNLRDNGWREGISGFLANENERYKVSTNFDYDISFMKENSPLRVIQPPVGYTIMDKNGQYEMIKNPSHFQISNEHLNTSKQGIFYSAILAAYFYQPLEMTYKSNKRKIEGYKTNPVAFMDQTSSIDGKEKSELKKKSEKTKKKMGDMKGRLDQLGFASGETYIIKQYLNERGDYVSYGSGLDRKSAYGGMDIYYNALTRGPFGLY